MPILIIFGIAIGYALIKSAIKNGIKEAQDEQDKKDKKDKRKD